jgi:tetratricopeptide (TPR) repeat protein
VKFFKTTVILFFVFASALPLFAQETTTNYIIAAREYLSAGKEMLAKQELDSALILSPNNPIANSMMGEYYERQNKYTRAILYYDIAIAANNSDPELYIERARMHRQLNNHRTYVLTDYNNAIRLDPENVEYYTLKADYQANNIHPDTHIYDFEGASATIAEALFFEKGDPNLYYLQAKYLVGAEQFLAALASINKAIQMDPQNDKYFAERGSLNFNLGKYQVAQRDFSRAISLNETEFSYYESRGHALFNQGDYTSAYDDYSLTIDMIIKAIASQKGGIKSSDPLNKSLRLTLLYRGMSLVQDDRPYDGCDDFERAFQMGEAKARNYMRQYCY